VVGLVRPEATSVSEKPAGTDGSVRDSSGSARLARTGRYDLDIHFPPECKQWDTRFGGNGKGGFADVASF